MSRRSYQQIVESFQGAWLKLLAINALVGLSTLLLGCGTAESVPDGQVFRMNLSAEPASLDPAYARDQAMSWMVQQLYSTLVELDDALQPKGLLAKRWAVSPDGLTYTFTLRQDVYYAKDACFGEAGSRAITAQDVVYCFTRLVNPKTASPGLWLFNGRIAGAEAYHNGEALSIGGLQAPNDSTVVITLAAPFPPFLSLLSMPYCSVLPPEAVKAYGRELARHPVGSGPYTLKSWQAGQSLLLQANTHYFEPGLPKTPAVQVRFVPNRLTAFFELLQGRLDFMDGIDPSLKDEALTPDGQLQEKYAQQVQFYHGPQLTTEYLGILQTSNLQTNPALLDPRMRQALSLAIDRQGLIRNLRNGLAYASRGLAPVGLSPALDAQLKPYPYKPEEARRLLTEAGYPNGQGMATINLLTSPNYLALAEYLQYSWSQLGVEVKIELMEGAAARNAIYGGQAQLWRASWVADYPDPLNFYGLVTSNNAAPGGPNTTRVSDSVLDSLFGAATVAAGDSIRAELYIQLEARLAEQAPLIPLFSYQIIRFYRNGWKGIPESASDLQMPLKNVSYGTN